MSWTYWVNLCVELIERWIWTFKNLRLGDLLNLRAVKLVDLRAIEFKHRNVGEYRVEELVGSVESFMFWSPCIITLLGFLCRDVAYFVWASIKVCVLGSGIGNYTELWLINYRLSSIISHASSGCDWYESLDFLFESLATPSWLIVFIPLEIEWLIPPRPTPPHAQTINKVRLGPGLSPHHAISKLKNHQQAVKTQTSLALVADCWSCHGVPRYRSTNECLSVDCLCFIQRCVQIDWWELYSFVTFS